MAPKVGGGLSVLVVTANPDFASACEMQLPAHADIDVTTASTVGDAVDVFVSESHDCIVSDHDLPDTDGIAFLEAVRAQAPTLPFVLFTTEGSEDIASRAISAGVTEYLVKESHSDQWGRLATLIEDAVGYYRTHGDFIEQESRTRTLLDAVDDTVAVVRDGRVEFINKSGVTLTPASTRAAVIGRPIDEVLTVEESTVLTEQLSAVQRREQSFDHVETRIRLSDGELRKVELTAAAAEWRAEPAAILIIRDISERHERESDLRVKNRAMDTAPIGITIADATEPDEPLIYVNDQFESLTGYTKAEVIGRNCRFLQGEDTDPEAVTTIRDAIEAEEPVSVELRNYRKDGTGFWNHVTIAPIRDADGDVTQYVGFQEDVTDRTERERTLRRFRRAIEAAGHAIYITDPDGVITYVNPAFECITGYDAEDTIGQTPRIIKSDEMSEGYYDRLWETLRDGDVWDEEIRNRRRSGEEYDAQQTIAPVTDESGAIEAFVAIQTDITTQKQRERQLRQYEYAIESASDLIAAIDEDYQFLFANQAYREFYDLDTGAVTDKTLPDVVGAETWMAIQSYVDRNLDGEPIQFEMTRSRPDQPDRTFDIRYHSLEQADEEIKGSMATMRDITEQRDRERQLSSLDRMLRHNLTNELNVITGRAEMIADRTTGEIAEWATVIERVAERVLDQAEKERDIVDFLSQPSSPAVVDVRKVATDVAERLGQRYPDADITVDVPAELELTTLPELERALEELVENAIVHTDRSPATVTIRAATDESRISLTVEDNGPGIPDEERQVIVDDAEIEPLLHSNGMGLWLVKRIVTRAGGTIRFDTAADRGSRVTLAVPRGQVSNSSLATNKDR